MDSKAVGWLQQDFGSSNTGFFQKKNTAKHMRRSVSKKASSHLPKQPPSHITTESTIAHQGG